MNSVIVLQARTNSSRLPAKVLLPIKSIPVVILAAKRAANTGRKIIVATSVEPMDDSLVDVIRSHDIQYYRGSLENTLDRFVNALADYADDTVVFRMTADNVFPDGKLLDDMEKFFLGHNLNYLCCNGIESGLPYGMSAEVTRLGCLREAHENATTDFEREHVTPYITNKYGRTYFTGYAIPGVANLRCTIDTLDDYLQVEEVFRVSTVDPLKISAIELVEELGRLQKDIIAKMPLTKLIMGTAQFGLTYGITNKLGQTSFNEAEAMLKIAIKNGVACIDTANAYGNSESVIGKSLVQGWKSRVDVVTKLSPLSECAKNASEADVNAFVEASIYKSCKELKVDSLDCLMLHRASHMHEWKGAVWRRLISFKQQSVIKSLGVSVYTPEELAAVLSNQEVEAIQLPYNIFDGRWNGLIQQLIAIKKTRRLTIHVRSVYLQGLLLSSNENFWQKANVDRPELINQWLDNCVKKFNRNSRADLCLAYARSQEWIDGLVLGMENRQQLIENIELFELPLLRQAELQEIDQTKPQLEEISLNPSKWRAA